MSAAEELSTGADAPYWQAMLEGRLSLQKCAACGTWHWPAVWRCSRCGGWEQAWEDVPMRGAIYTWARTWHPFAGLESLERPFVSVVVALDGAGGARLMGRLADGGADVSIGQRVVGAVENTSYAGTAVPAIVWSRA